MNPVWVGALCGGLAGAGLLLAVFSLPVVRRRSLGDRIAPYVGDLSPRTTLDRDVAGWGLSHLVTPLWRDLATRLGTILGGATSVRSRLAAVGEDGTLEGFRIEQVLWAALGAAAALVGGGLAAWAGWTTVWGILLLVPAFALAGIVLRDHVLTRQADRADAQVLAEFPVVADMLALAVTAGEGPLGAIDRITRLARGRLVEQLGSLLAETRSGTPFLTALTDLRDRTRLTPLARFLDGMAVAVERGTPLADVLRAQAADVRELSKRQLLEVGGRKEIAMMVPVVFLILPVTVLFAVYPGLVGLTTIAR